MGVGKGKVKVAQSCPTLCNPMHYTAHRIFQARILDWAAYPFSRGSSQTRDQTQVSRIAGGFFYQLSHKGSGGGEYKGNLCTFHLIFTVNLKLLLKIKSIFFKMSFPHSTVHGGCWQGFQLLGRQDKALLCALSLHRPRGPSGSRRAGV